MMTDNRLDQQVDDVEIVMQSVTQSKLMYDLSDFPLQFLSDTCWSMYNQDAEIFQQAFDHVIYSLVPNSDNILIHELFRVKWNAMNDVYYKCCHPEEESSVIFFANTPLQPLKDMNKKQFLIRVINQILIIVQMPNLNKFTLYKFGNSISANICDEILEKYSRIFKYNISEKSADISFNTMDNCCASGLCCIACNKNRQDIVRSDKYMRKIYGNNMDILTIIQQNLDITYASATLSGIVKYMLDKVFACFIKEWTRSVCKIVSIYQDKRDREETICDVCAMGATYGYANGYYSYKHASARTEPIDMV